MKEIRLINRFSEKKKKKKKKKKKILIWANGPFWAPKLGIITLDPLEKCFKNFAQ